MNQEESKNEYFGVHEIIEYFATSDIQCIWEPNTKESDIDDSKRILLKTISEK